MTVDEFVTWDDGTDTRYELIDGIPTAVPLATLAHGALVVAAGAALHAHTRGRCIAAMGSGVLIPGRQDTFYLADMVVQRAPALRSRLTLDHPVLILEVLMTDTAEHDRGRKGAHYREIGSLEDLVFLDSEEIRAELWKRTSAGWEMQSVNQPGSIVALGSIGAELLLGAFYDKLPADWFAGPPA